MGLHIIGSTRDYGGDDNPPEHGRDTAVYQELQPIIAKYSDWLRRNKGDLFNDELIALADLIGNSLDRLSDELNTPL